MSKYAIDPTTDYTSPGGATGHGTVLSFQRRATGLMPAVLDAKLAELFPNVDPGHHAVGVRILVQLKRVPEKTAGGLIKPIESQEADQAATPYGKVVNLGSACFTEAQTGMRHSPDFKAGDYVRIPKWIGDKFAVDGVTFTFYNWWDVIGRVEPELLLT